MRHSCFFLYYDTAPRFFKGINIIYISHEKPNATKFIHSFIFQLIGLPLRDWGYFFVGEGRKGVSVDLYGPRGSYIYGLFRYVPL